MNEIDKLKIENTRYKNALEKITVSFTSDAPDIAYKALNPTPPPPVTLEALVTALRKNRAGGYSIEFFGDESGHISDENGKKLAAFYSFQEALDFLTGVQPIAGFPW